MLRSPIKLKSFLKSADWYFALMIHNSSDLLGLVKMQTLQGFYKILGFNSFLERSCKKIYSLSECYKEIQFLLDLSKKHLLVRSCKKTNSLQDCFKMFSRNALLAKFLQEMHFEQGSCKIPSGIQRKCIILQDLERFLQDSCKILAFCLNQG